MRQDGPYVQVKGEGKYHPFDFTNDLIEGATITGATALLTNPDGTTEALSGVVVSSPVVYVFLPAAEIASATGDYYVDVTATVDNAGSLVDETLKWRRHVHVPR
jgi:hypothetical protein